MSVAVTICISPRRALALVLFGTLSATALRAAESVQSPPPNVRACVAETDPGKRLACYDREMARSSETPSAAPAPAAAAVTAPATKMATTPAPERTPAAVVHSEDTVVHAKTAEQLLPQHISARIVKIEVLPYRLIFHLDNEQAWTHERDASIGTNFRVGESVTLDRIFGSYWISTPTTTRLKVHFIS